MPRKTSEKQRIIQELTKVPGIGQSRAEAIYNKCGRSKCLEQIESNFEQVAAKTGLSVRLLEQAKEILKPPAFGRRVGSAEYLTVLSDDEEVREELSYHWHALQQQKRYCDLVLQKHHDRLTARPDVTGIHVGLWRRDGKVVCPLQYCIRVHVAEKLRIVDKDKKLLSANSLMPTPIEGTLDGVRVDVLQQTYRAIAGLPGHATVRAEVIRGGIPISTEDHPDNWGTLGMAVLAGERGFLRYLTNSHVVGAATTKVQQPASSRHEEGLEIGEVEVSVKDDLIDAALIKPKRGKGQRKPERDVLGVSGDYTDGILTDADRANGTQVFKVGATTGIAPRVVGTVKNIRATIDVGGRIMKNQILVESNSRIIEPGDSGSVLIVKTDSGINKVVGLVHAQTVTKHGVTEREGFGLVACHIHEVRERFNISI